MVSQFSALSTKVSVGVGSGSVGTEVFVEEDFIIEGTTCELPQAENNIENKIRIGIIRFISGI